MLLDQIRAFLRKDTSAPATATTGPDPVHVAACTLMLDIAWADGEFTAPERAHLEGVLARHFSLPAEAGRELIALCERERLQAVDHFQFTRVLREQYDVGQKMVLAEIMWGLVLADGKVADHEHYLT
ncbi:MAG: TerB family tellurite resistance protein, partial [Gemmatimonadetes bacterium]|nr:TerB family tellurite resistance protein [Gemmatimonadota bacterium]